MSEKNEKDKKRNALTPVSGRRHTCSAYVSIPLLNTFCRLAATRANTLPRPSNYSIVTATGSKRSSADSDSLLCYVRLRRTSRLKFWCGTGCEHSKIRFILIVPSAHKLNPRPRHPLSSGRADNACTNLLGFLVRYVRTRGSMRLRRVRDYRLSLCYLPHALAAHCFLRLTRARGVSSQREGNALFADFWYFSSQKSTIKEKFLYVSIRRQQALPCLGDADRVCFANRSIPALRDKIKV